MIYSFKIDKQIEEKDSTKLAEKEVKAWKLTEFIEVTAIFSKCINHITY